jgi:hypothetical protein
MFYVGFQANPENSQSCEFFNNADFATAKAKHVRHMSLGTRR